MNSAFVWSEKLMQIIRKPYPMSVLLSIQENSNFKTCLPQSILTLGRTRGGGCHPPLRFFFDNKTSAPDVLSSCSFIPRTHFETSVVKISYYGYGTRYDVISSGWSSHFWVKMLVFSTSFNNLKVKIRDEMMLSAYLCVILYVKHKKLPFLAVLAWFPIVDKIQDNNHCWWRHRPPAASPPIKYTSSCWEDQRLSTEGKIASKYCNISKTLGRGSMNNHPSFLVPQWGYEFSCTSEG